jgi:glycosyltransferase involved in cell wall biosynthesis
MNKKTNLRLKVLWFSNVAFTELNSNTTGSWIHSMSELLMMTEEVELFNITQGKVNQVIRKDCKSISQWFIPTVKLRKNGLPNYKNIDKIQQIVQNINPDIIHIWGTENYWGLLSSRGYVKGNILLEIQGLKYAYAKYFFSGLTFLQIIRCFRLKEFVKPFTSLLGQKIKFERWGKFEKEMISNTKFISTQSEWVRAHIININRNASIIETEIALRSAFLNALKWDLKTCMPFQVFTSVSTSALSYKGLHTLIDAIAILKNKFPGVKLLIGGHSSVGLKSDGYSKWLRDKIRNSEIEPNVHFLGPLDAENIVIQLQSANVVVVPSFIETYCLALHEALTVGVPTVVSFAGAMPEFAKDKDNALFYPPGDAEMCANAIESLFLNKELALRISTNAYLQKKMNVSNVGMSQLKIYKTIIQNQIK